MASESLQGVPGVAAGSARSGSNVLLTVLFFILALAVLAGAVYYVGGVGYVTSLLNKGAAPGGSSNTNPAAGAAAAVPTSTAPAVSTTQLQLPAGVTEDLAKRMYVEEIQSQVNLNKMAAGEIARFDVTKVELSKNKDAAAIRVQAYFTDKTSAPGIIQLVKPAGAWYFMSFTGLNTATASGYAEPTNQGTVAFGLQSNQKVIADSGVTEFDYGVINTLLAAQTADQTIVTGIVDGTLSKIGLGAPLKGAGTTTVPANLTGSAPKPVAGEAVLIHTTCLLYTSPSPRD